MAVRVRELARGLGVPVGVVLEGGYNHDVLAECVCATLPALAGAGSPQEFTTAPAEDAVCARAVAQHSRYWPL
jgi:acetoin utilization deacetylase AcuC-like enzyme